MPWPDLKAVLGMKLTSSVVGKGMLNVLGHLYWTEDVGGKEDIGVPTRTSRYVMRYLRYNIMPPTRVVPNCIFVQRAAHQKEDPCEEVNNQLRNIALDPKT